MREKLFQLKLKRLEKRGRRHKQIQELKDIYYPEKSKKKVSNVMLVIIVCAITIYTIASFWLIYTTGNSIDSTLTTCFYTFWGSEIVALTAIKVAKVRKNTDYYDINMDTEMESDSDFDEEI